MSARGARVVWSALLVLILVGSSALADENESVQRKARAHYRQGLAHSQAGNYAIAADELKTAYELGHAPECLLQLGHVYRLAENKPAALDAYKRFLEASPEGAGADEALRWVVALEKGVRRAPPAPPPAAEPPPPPPAPPAEAEGSVYDPFGHSGSREAYDFGPGTRRAATSRRATPTRPREEDDDQPAVAPAPAAARIAVAPAAEVRAEEPGPPRPLLRRPWFWATVSVGAAVIIGLGVGLGVGLSSSQPFYGTVDVR